MTKRLVDIDDELLAQAQTALGEGTMKGTVAAALELAVRVHAGRALMELQRDPEVTAIADRAVMDSAWR